MLQQLKAFTRIKDTNTNNLFLTLDKRRTNYCNNQIIEQHKLSYINKFLFYKVTTYRITAFSELLLNSISQVFCQNSITLPR